MAQILDPLLSSDPDVALCCYVNATSKIQVARITNVPDWYFERVVFPGQRLMFEAPETALLEIHTGMMASSILSDTIPCQRLVMTSSPIPSGPLNAKLTGDEPTGATSPMSSPEAQPVGAGAD